MYVNARGNRVTAGPVVAVLVMLGGCGGGSRAAPPRVSTATSPTTTAIMTPTTTSTASTSPNPVAIGCRSNQLQLSFDKQLGSASNQTGAFFQLRNISDRGALSTDTLGSKRLTPTVQPRTSPPHEEARTSFRIPVPTLLRCHLIRPHTSASAGRSSTPLMSPQKLVSTPPASPPSHRTHLLLSPRRRRSAGSARKDPDLRQCSSLPWH